MIPVIEGNVNRALGAGKEQSFTFRVFANGIDWLVFSNTADDFLPGFAGVVSAVNVRMKVVEAKAIDRGIYRRGIEV